MPGTPPSGQLTATRITLKVLTQGLPELSVFFAGDHPANHPNSQKLDRMPGACGSLWSIREYVESMSETRRLCVGIGGRALKACPRSVGLSAVCRRKPGGGMPKLVGRLTETCPRCLECMPGSCRRHARGMSRLVRGDLGNVMSVPATYPRHVLRTESL